MGDAKAMIEEINRAVSEDRLDLNEWESEFVSSIGSRLQAGGSLTERQDAVLEKLWKKATA